MELDPDLAVEEELNDGLNREVKKRKATLKLTDAVFRDNELTEGGLVKGRKEVVKHRVSKVGTQPHVNCRVQTFGAIMGDLCPMKLKWVKDMGMGGLLHLHGKSLPRSLCYWLMSKVDPVKRVFISSPGCEYPFHKNQVFWVLGIPKGPKKVPMDLSDDRMKAAIDAVHQKYGVVSAGNTRYLSMPKVMDMVESDCTAEDEYDFKVAFLALALADVLCPTTCPRLATDLFPSLSVAMEAQSYDWSSFVLDRLMYSARRFALNFYRDGYAKGCGGCTYFLAIFYLDRLNRIPVHWGVFPRIRAWEDDDVNKAKIEDRLDRGSASDYGRLEFVDLAYGEQHPRGARDTGGPHAFASEVAKLILSGIGEDEVGGYVEEDEVLTLPVGKRKAQRQGPKDKSNPYLRKLAKRARERTALRGGGSSAFSVDLTLKDKDEGSVGANLVNEKDDDADPETEGGGVQEGMMDWMDVGAGSGYMSHEELANSSEQEDCTEATIHNVVSRIREDCLFSVASPASRELLQLENDVSVELDGSASNLKEGFTAGNHIEREEVDGVSPRGSSHSQVDSGAESVGDPEGVEEPQLSGRDFDSRETCEGGAESFNGRKLTRSRPRRGTKPSEMQKSKDFVVSLVPRKNPLIKARLLNYVKSVGREIEKDPSSTSESDIVMIRVGEYFATVRHCFSLLAPTTTPLDENYVRVAGALYTKVWKKKFGESSVRYMLDPAFASTMLDEQGPPSDWNRTKSLAEGYVKPLCGMPAERFHVIFVPVFEAGGWWCAAYCVNTVEIWVIDSSKAEPVGVHDQFLRKLSFGVDLILNTLDGTWEIGKSESWPRKAVFMDAKEEGSGVRMLVAIKGCADRYRTEITTGSLVEEGRRILTEDVTDDSNEARTEVKEIFKQVEKVKEP